MSKLSKHFREHNASIAMVIVMSACVNFLGLTGSFFMLLVYDKAIPSNSMVTLLALCLIALLLYLFYGVFDFYRGRILARIGAQTQVKLDRRVMSLSALGESGQPKITNSDLDKVSQFLASPISLSALDIFWSPIFVICCFLFHPWLGYFTLGSILLMVAIAAITQRFTTESINSSQFEFWRGHNLGREIIIYREQVIALGMLERMLNRWDEARLSSHEERLLSGDLVGAFVSLSKVTRLIAQSGILAVGGYLVISHQIPAGIMIAGSILLGRALAPIDQTISQWRLVAEARNSWKVLSAYLKNLKDEKPMPMLPFPQGVIEFHSVYFRYEGSTNATLKNVSFKVPQGKVLGIIGSNGSGKSTLVKILVGQFAPISGDVTIDDASIKNFNRETIGFSIGYMPQKNFMFNGTVADNISRFDTIENHEKEVLHAARAADCHNLIMKLDNGYDTILPGQLSSGQLQRISLARALYRDPKIIVLDEPSTYLDEDGRRALSQVIASARNAGKTVIVVAHNRAAIRECDILLALVDGHVQSLGERKELINNSARLNAGST